MSWERIDMRAVVSIDYCVVGPDVRLIPEPLVSSSPWKTTRLSFSVETIYKISSRPIEAPQITDSLNKVQLAVEEKYRDIRGQIFLFDDVLNEQCKIFHRKRQNVLFSSTDETLNIMEGYNEQTVLDIVKVQTKNDGWVKVDKVLKKIGQFFSSVLRFFYQLEINLRITLTRFSVVSMLKILPS